MQYIQLQGQVAAELDLPINGAYNLFIDTSDNSIKAKDGDGVITGGGNSLTEVTKTQLDGHIASGSLTPGTFYKITGVSSGSSERYIQEGGTTVILQAATTSSLNSRGVGLFWNPKYYNPNTDEGEYQIWDDTFEFTISGSFTGQFFDMEETINLDAPSNIVLKPNILDNSAFAFLTDPSAVSFFMDPENYPISFESANTGITGSLTAMDTGVEYLEGDKVIYGGKVWQNLSGSLGNTNGTFALDEQEWVFVNYNHTDYNLVADIIEYDYQNDIICYRKDVTRSIEVTTNYEYLWDDEEYNGIRSFPWGHPRIFNVSLENTSTDSLVNIGVTNIIEGLHTKSRSRFDADYWGTQNEFYDISLDCNSEISNLFLGKYGTYRRLSLGIGSTIGGVDNVYAMGNDGNTLSDITLGANSTIWGINMYQYARLDDISMEMNSNIYLINMYDESEMRDLDMSINSEIHDTSMGSSTEIYDITLQAGAYISYINMSNNSEIYGINLGRNSYISYTDLYDNCSIYNITLGAETGVNCMQLYNEDNNSSSINNISLGDNSDFGSIDLYSGTYISNISGIAGANFGEITLTGSNAFISDFDLGQNSSFGGLTVNTAISGGASLQHFQIGQDAGFGGEVISTHIEQVTIERGFNNYKANELTAGVTGSSLSYEDRNTVTELDPSKSFHVLDTAGWTDDTTNLYYYLSDGNYEGQVVRFFYTNTSTLTSTGPYAGQIVIIMDNLSLPGSFNDTYQSAWYPFTEPYQGFGNWRMDIPTLVWINGKWIIDNSAWWD